MNKKVFFILLTFCFATFLFNGKSVHAENAEDLLYQKDVTYSGVEGGKSGDDWNYPQFVGENAVDGDPTTRWSADKTDDQWLVVDIGEEKKIGEIILQFHAESPQYEILASKDGDDYQSIYKEEEGDSGKEAEKHIDVDDDLTARYVKYQQHIMKN